MKVIRSHRIIFCDVDETLVLWDWKTINPEGNGLIYVANFEHKELLMPHERHIEMLKQFKARGHTVVIWSQGGYRWAESVVIALGLENIVDIVIDKPSWYIDDLPASAWMPKNIYLDPLDPSKDKSSWNIKKDD